MASTHVWRASGEEQPEKVKKTSAFRIYLFCVILSELLMPVGIGLQINYITYYVLKSGSTFFPAVVAAIITMIILIASYLETRNDRLRAPFAIMLFVVFFADIAFLSVKIITHDHNSLFLMLLGLLFRLTGMVLLLITTTQMRRRELEEADNSK